MDPIKLKCFGELHDVGSRGPRKGPDGVVRLYFPSGYPILAPGDSRFKMIIQQRIEQELSFVHVKAL